jgi:pyruvate,water dikinase
MVINFSRLSAVRSTDRMRVGGKAATLGELMQADFPVPAGFVLHADARECSVGFDGMLAELGAGPFAVRSSACAEDGRSASWAGQLESIVGISAGAVPAAIRKCQDSLVSDRAKAYLQKHPGSNLAMGVIVQRIVAPEVSGVVFTRDPVHASSENLVIEVVQGFGESLVSGFVTPDYYCVDRETGMVSQRVTGNQTKKLLLSNNGLVWQLVSERDGVQLSDNQLEELRLVSLRIERLLGYSCDIEWAYSEDKLWILQARAITTL